MNLIIDQLLLSTIHYNNSPESESRSVKTAIQLCNGMAGNQNPPTAGDLQINKAHKFVAPK